MLRPLLPIPPIHFFAHSSSLFLVPPGSSFSFFSAVILLSVVSLCAFVLQTSLYASFCLLHPLFALLLCPLWLHSWFWTFPPILLTSTACSPPPPSVSPFSPPSSPSPFCPLLPHIHKRICPLVWSFLFSGELWQNTAILFFSPFALSISFSVPTKFKKKKSSIITVVTNRFSPPTSPLCHMTSHPAGHYGQSTS